MKMFCEASALVFMLCLMVQAQENLGHYSANPYGEDSSSNPYSRSGSPYRSDSPKNPYGSGWTIIGE